MKRLGFGYFSRQGAKKRQVRINIISLSLRPLRLCGKYPDSFGCGAAACASAVNTSSQKTRNNQNIKRDPRISLLVYGEKFNGSNYIQIDGKAEVIEHPRAMDIVLDWHRQIRGVPDNWDDIRKKTLSEGRIAIRVTIEKAGPQSKSRGQS